MKIKKTFKNLYTKTKAFINKDPMQIFCFIILLVITWDLIETYHIAKEIPVDYSAHYKSPEYKMVMVMYNYYFISFYFIVVTLIFLLVITLKIRVEKLLRETIDLQETVLKKQEEVISRYRENKGYLTLDDVLKLFNQKP